MTNNKINPGDIWKKYPDDMPQKYEVRNHSILLVHKNKGIMHDQLQWDGEDECYHLREYEFHRSKIKEYFTHWCYESDLIASITPPINDLKFNIAVKDNRGIYASVDDWRNGRLLSSTHKPAIVYDEGDIERVAVAICNVWFEGSDLGKLSFEQEKEYYLNCAKAAIKALTEKGD